MSNDTVVIPPLKTEEEYEKALTEIKTLWNAKNGSPEETRLYVLAELVSNYERAKEPLPDDDNFDYESDDRQRKPKGKKLHTFRKNAF